MWYWACVESFDAVIVGAGPNGLAAAIALASWGHSVCVVEARPFAGGGLHSNAERETGYIFDECSAIHPMGVLSPYFRILGLDEHGLEFCTGDSSVAHPLLDRPAAILFRDFERTVERLSARDGRSWRQIFQDLIPRAQTLLLDLMGPLNLLPRDPVAMLRFGWLSRLSARSFVTKHFRDVEAQALFSGLAAHSVLPLEMPLTAAFGMIFGLSAHVTDWPCVKGGSGMLAQALVRKFEALGGRLVVGHSISSWAEIPESRVVLFDLSPEGLARIAANVLPNSYKRRLAAYRYGPGTFKVDWTLSGSIPWLDPAVRGASTVHVGGTAAQIAASERAAFQGDPPTDPYLIVCQQSEMDPSRAPASRHTGYAYCHVPNGFSGDLSALIEKQMDRYAPGFRDLILTRHSTSPRDFQSMNPNFIGGAITGGAADWRQLFTRPVARLDPYSTPNPRIFICSASTPPGGGVHGMCGYYAARSAARRLGTHVPRLLQRAGPTLNGLLA